MAASADHPERPDYDPDVQEIFLWQELHELFEPQKLAQYEQLAWLWGPTGEVAIRGAHCHLPYDRGAVLQPVGAYQQKPAGGEVIDFVGLPLHVMSNESFRLTMADGKLVSTHRASIAETCHFGRFMLSQSVFAAPGQYAAYKYLRNLGYRLAPPVPNMLTDVDPAEQQWAQQQVKREPPNKPPVES
ncbi:MAG TPA: hypothetical protein VLF91_05710 [Candidatus Saccharimonadales bacterium]|nr:hypothetical protein [Candidatus Saccharimonadales bacterium]